MRNAMSQPAPRAAWLVLLFTLAAGFPAAPRAEQQDQALAHQRGAPAQNASVTIRKYQVTASEGRIVPGHLRAKVGDIVRITFVSRDDTYGIRFKDFGVKQKLTPDKPITIELRPTQAGEFEFRCTRTWDVKHFGKNGTLVVTE